MLTISDPAAARMVDLLHTRAGHAVLRIIRRKDRLQLRVSLVRPGDQTFAHGGRVVLALDEGMHRSLSRRKLDVRQTVTGPRLRLKPH